MIWRWEFSGPFSFYDYVKGKGKWDYKTQVATTPWIPDNGAFRVFGKKMTVEELGNLNYGFTGAAVHFPPAVLRMAGGIVAIKNNGINWSDWWYDFDSKEDFEMVQLGIDMEYYVLSCGMSIEEALKWIWK